MKLTPIAPDNFAAVLALNNRHAIELSWLDLDRLTRIVEAAYYAYASSDRSAFMIALDQDADYDSPNFLWFRERFASFIYVDRIVVDPSGRRQGFARELYRDLFARARKDGHEVVGCEVNRDPPNPASDRFHEALGFQTEGEAPITSGKTVRYLSRPLGDPSEPRPFGEIP
jgi:predicted GNAT superfamily acetyltransferase